MAKVITFSRVFPKGHPKQGQDTLFVEKLMLGFPYFKQEFDIIGTLPLGLDRLDEIYPKYHTIRNGKRFKAGDLFSPRVWLGKPYNSKQFCIAPELEVKKVFDIEIYPTNEVMINGKFFCSFGSENWHTLCKNDGLNSEDMRNWFSKLPFKGQIICWNENINY
jgi:hypothetical protein